MDRRRKALFTLLFLSPAFGELVSGSSPPLEFFNPLALAAFFALYGCGALLIRDAVVRWDKGWATLLSLGLAYGAYEEGLVVKSWFDPGWVDLGVLGDYGRAGGVNWVWAQSLSVYHAVISIALPIFIVGVLFPDLKRERLLTDRATKWALFFFVLILPVFALGLPYWGGPEHLIALIAAAGLTLIARQLPKDLVAPRASHVPPRAWPFAAFGFAWMLGTFVFYNIAASIGLYFGVAMALGALATAAALVILQALLVQGCAERFVFAFLAGAEAFFILVGFFAGIFAPAAFFGQWAVAIVAAAWFALLYRRTKPRWLEAEAAHAKAAGAAPVPASSPAP